MRAKTRAFIFCIVYVIILYLLGRFLGYNNQDKVEFTIGMIFVTVVNIHFRNEDLKK